MYINYFSIRVKLQILLKITELSFCKKKVFAYYSCLYWVSNRDLKFQKKILQKQEKTGISFSSYEVLKNLLCVRLF